MNKTNYPDIVVIICAVICIIVYCEPLYVKIVWCLIGFLNLIKILKCINEYMNSENENPTDSLILQEKKYIEEDKKLIKCVEDCLCVLQERYTQSKESYRIKNAVNSMTELVQYEQEKLNCRKKRTKSLISRFSR